MNAFAKALVCRRRGNVLTALCRAFSAVSHGCIRISARVSSSVQTFWLNPWASNKAGALRWKPLDMSYQALKRSHMLAPYPGQTAAGGAN